MEECVQYIKRMVPAFTMYTYEQQKKICQAAMYDRWAEPQIKDRLSDYLFSVCKSLFFSDISKKG